MNDGFPLKDEYYLRQRPVMIYVWTHPGIPGCLRSYLMSPFEIGGWNENDELRIPTIEIRFRANGFSVFRCVFPR